MAHVAKSIKGLPEPRDYQTQLLEIAKSRNSIICLPTGSGKTYIAVKLIEAYKSELLDDFRDPNAKRTIFLCPTKPLVAQQAGYIERHLDVNVARYTGESMIAGRQIDSWNESDWNTQFNEYHVFVMTPKLLVDLVELKRFLSLRKVNLIVFDEAHHAGPDKKLKKSNSHYSQIADSIRRYRVSERPRILALSASLVKNNLKAHYIPRVVEILEETLNSTCATITGIENLGGCGTNPNEYRWEYKKLQVNSNELASHPLIHKLQEMFEFVMKVLEDLNSGSGTSVSNVRRSVIYEDESSEEEFFRCTPAFYPIHMKDLRKILQWIFYSLHTMGPWCARISIKHFITCFERKISLHQNTFRAFADFLRVFIEIFDRAQKTLTEILAEVTDERLVILSVTPQMQRLLELLANYNPVTSSKKLCGIIFVRLRNECQILSQWLSEVAQFDEKKYGFLKVGYAVGVASAPQAVTSLVKENTRNQEKVLSQFRAGELNLLIATSVLEEGIDVPHCNLVCRYNPATTYRDYVQSKGRARDPEADYVLFCEENDKATKENINYFREVDERLKAMCKDRGLYRSTEDEDYSEPETNVLISKTGARITLNMSIDVVHNYCAKLPSDSFSQPRPVDFCDIEVNAILNKLFQYTVQMPMNSGVCKVVGPWNAKRMTAKKLAYLEVCRQLYENGKINDNFVPPKMEKYLRSYYEELGLPVRYGDEEVVEGIIPGTRRRRQQYEKEIHSCFRSDGDTTKNEYFLYLIETEMETDVVTEFKVGVVSRTKWPLKENLISSFPVFSKYKNRERTIEVSVHTLQENIQMSSGEVQTLKCFHAFILGHALRRDRKKENIDLEKFDSSYFFVLLDKNNIAWNEINKVVSQFDTYNNFTPIENNGVKMRNDFRYIPKDYVDAVVVPWYREGNVYYRVECSDPHKRPNSPFPKKDYSSFSDYFSKKYDAKVTTNDQLLLDVKNVENLFAYLRPRNRTRKHKNYEIRLVPELCLILPFSYPVYSLFLPLPAIFHRLNQIYLAEKFRNKVHCEAFGESLKTQIVPLRFHNNQVVENDSDVGDMWWEGSDDDDDESMEIVDSDEDWEKVFDEQPASEMNNDTNATQDEVVQHVVHMNNVSTNKPIVVKGVDDRNLAFNSVPVEKVGTGLPLKSFNIDDNFDWHNFKARIEIDLKLTYKRITERNRRSENIESSDAENIESDTQHEESGKIKTEIKNERIETFDETGGVIESPNANLILQAFTSKRCEDVFNSERLEMIGDSFLKFSSALYMFCKYPEVTVDFLVRLKDKQVSNFNLYRLGKLREIPKQIGFHKFSSSLWVSSIFNEEERFQEIDDKSVADCVEALIGAYLLKTGPKGAIIFMKWFGLNVTDKDFKLNDDHWVDTTFSSISKYVSDEIDADKLVEKLYINGQMSKFETLLGYHFKEKSHLVKAFTHSSYYYNTVTGCYQRFEFLGDAILDYLITRYIYEDNVQFSPGELTDLRQALVHNEIFGCLAVKYKFHKYLKHLCPDVFSKINSFEEQFIGYENDLIYGQFLIVTSTGSEDNEEIEIPKILGDIFESVAAAIYLDSGFSLDAVWKVYYKFFEPLLKRFSENIPKSPSRQLHESDARQATKTKFEKPTVNENGKFSVVVETHGEKFVGFGKNKRFARQDAARKAVIALKRMNKLFTKVKEKAVNI